MKGTHPRLDCPVCGRDTALLYEWRGDAAPWFWAHYRSVGRWCEVNQVWRRIDRLRYDFKQEALYGDLAPTDQAAAEWLANLGR